MQKDEELNTQNNEGEGKASGDTDNENVAGMGKEIAKEPVKEETKDKTTETNEEANLGKEKKETPATNKVTVDKEVLQANF